MIVTNAKKNKYKHDMTLESKYTNIGVRQSFDSDTNKVMFVPLEAQIPQNLNI